MKNYIVGNWKMNQTREQVESFFQKLQSDLDTINNEAWIAPQFIHLDLAQSLTQKSPLQIGAQNCSHKESGAYTGEVSPVTLADSKCHFVILGHSERRAYFNESHEFLNEKLHLAQKSGLKVIFCFGETLEEREAGKTFDIIKEQLVKGLKGVTAEQQNNLLLAYEPVWAIGTGKTATPEQAQEVHAHIRNVINDIGLQANELPILYGGSVKPANIKELMSQKDINGALVGGASLKAEDFLSLCQA